jgi:hypothetical protein
VESNGIRKMHEPSPVPTLYVGRVEELLWLVPLFPCYLDGNTTSTIQYKYTARQKEAFRFRCADGWGPASRRGRPQPRVGGLSVAKNRKDQQTDQKHPCALGKPGGPARMLLKSYDKYIPVIYLAYTTVK